VTIVIPTLNEAEAIGKVLDELRQQGFSNILVVDGGSTDGTLEIVSSRGVKVIQQEGKGKADAIKTAVKYVKTPFMLIMDGDYTYPAAEIYKLLQKANNNDLVIGARKYGRENIPLFNRLGNWIITKAFNFLFGTNLTDVCSGMYLMRTRVARELHYETKRFSIEVEVAAQVAATSRKMSEVSINYRKRLGKSKLTKRHGLEILKDIILLAWKYNPVFFIFSLTTILLAPSIIIVIWVMYEYLVKGVKHFVWAIIGTTLLTTAILSAILSILSIYLKRMEYRLYEKISQIQYR